VTTFDHLLPPQPYPLAFATVSGAHLYGFPSVDSDVDIRGMHILPVESVIGLDQGPETVQHMGIHDGIEVDLVTHDLLKFCRLLVKNNGYVAEQLLSPLVIETSEAHRELVILAPRCLTRHHVHHYLGFAATQWRLFESTRELKPALYTLRVLLTGIHLMGTGEVVADLRQLWHDHDLPYVPDLIAAKREGEHRQLERIVTAEALGADVERLRGRLTQAAEDTRLPVAPDRAAVNDFVIRTRRANLPMVG
jgi:predicted nucleotidyltransferase